MATPIQDWFTGTGRFQLLRRLGAGGMGVVYEALDRERGMRVALKTLSSFDVGLLYLLKQEFRALQDISHPNLAKLYELISEDDRWFFTMEFIEGVNFLDYLRETSADQPTQTIRLDETVDLARHSVSDLPRPAPWRKSQADMHRLRSVLRQLAEGVHALHTFGKLHLDIKPTNLMLSAAGHLTILDFGLVMNVHHELESNRRELRGTPRYMAPEQARAEDLTAAADWYAVGCTLFEALTGQPVFPGKAYEILLAKQHQVAPVPSELVTGVPPDLDQLCVDLLRRNPEERPGGLEILQHLGASRSVAAVAVDEPDVIVGREPQMEILRHALARAQSGRETLVFVHGHSGFGKSTLIHQFLLETVRRGDSLVLEGRCYEQETVPYKAFDSLVDAMASRLEELSHMVLQSILPSHFLALTRIFPVLRRFEELAAPAAGYTEDDALDLRRHALRALRELIRGLAGLRPLVLFIDDLQWGDLDSASLLSGITGSRDDVSLMVICAYRTENAATSRCLKALAGLEREEVEVGPLSPVEARDLVLRLLPPGQAERADAIVAESKGNPYFVRELAAQASTGGAEVSLDDALWKRTQALPAPALRMLELIAVSGQPLRQSDAFSATAIGADDISLLLELRVGRLIRTTGVGRCEEVETYHDRIRECVVARLSPAALIGHHRQLAVTLEQAGAYDAQRVGTHYEAAGEAGVAVRYFVQAADQASKVLAFDRACDLYQHSLALVVDEPERQPLMVNLAEVLANAGRGPEAARQYRAAAAGATDEDQLRLEERAAYHFCASGYVDEGREAYGKVLARLGANFPSSPQRAVADTLAYGVLLQIRGFRFKERDEGSIPAKDLLRADTLWAAGTGLGMVDHALGGAFAKRSLVAALRLGEPFRIARNLAWEAAFLASLGPRFVKSLRRTIDSARSIAERTENPAALGWTHLAESFAGLHCGDWVKAVREAGEAERIFRQHCRDVSWERATAQTCSLFAHVGRGDFAELRSRAPELLDDANRRGNLYAATTVQGWVTPQLHLAAGDPAGARHAAQDAVSRWTQQGFHLQHIFHWNNGMYACLYEGDGEGALAEAERPWAAVKSSLLFRVLLLRAWSIDARARSWLLAAATRRERRDLIKGVLKMARSLDGEGVVWTSAAAARLRAGVAFLRGDREASLALLRQSERLTVEAGMFQFQASLRYVLGSLAGGEEGRALQKSAEDWMQAEQVADPARFVAMHLPGFGN